MIEKGGCTPQRSCWWQPKKLFYTKGDEKTSIQDILDEVGFSKGGFYHHFDSKLIRSAAPCEQRAQEICQSAAVAVGEGEKSASEELNALSFLLDALAKR
ncbi:MAG: TetR/AcrR family transcriptional regulator [Christensenellales bacterium]